MGTKQSKESSIDIGQYVGDLGDAYGRYVQDILDSGISFNFLQSLNEKTFYETCEDLNISSRLHQRVLLSEWKRYFDNVEVEDTQVSVEDEEDVLLLEETECTKPIYHSDVRKRRHSSYPMDPQEGIRCSILPQFNENVAKAADMPHIPPSIWDINDQLGIDHAPIHKDDIEREAALSELGLMNMQHDEPAGIAIKQLCSMALTILKTPVATVSIPTYDQDLLIGPSFNSPEAARRMAPGIETLSEDEDGEPFISRIAAGRGTVVCNYPIYTRETFVVRDLWKDKSFEYLKEEGLYRFYAGTPLFYHGQPIAIFAIMGYEDRPDFTQAHEIQLEQISALVSQQIELWALKKEMTEMQTIQAAIEEKLRPPDDYAALIHTDIEGSTRMWEENPETMSQMLHIHDQTMRSVCAEYGGYEILTEGDAFQIAFHEASDAVAFCLKVQEKLYSAEYTEDMLKLSHAKEIKQKSLRGPRVRMAVHYDKVHFRDNGVSGRREYFGETYEISKSVEHLAHGGQILVTSDVWAHASCYLDSKLGSAQVLDLGKHLLVSGSSSYEGVVSKGILQLVPASLAFDYFSFYERGSLTGELSEERGIGRQFPPPLSRRQLTPSFLEAPHIGQHVAIVFIYTDSIVYRYPTSSAMILAALANRIATLLKTSGSTGYQCKNNMLAFRNGCDGARFSLDLQDDLKKNIVCEKDLGGMVKIGVYEGQFTKMGPNATSGRADYYGKVVNRAARLAQAADEGTVVTGHLINDTMGRMESCQLKFVGPMQFKGVEDTVQTYICFRL